MQRLKACHTVTCCNFFVHLMTGCAQATAVSETQQVQAQPAPGLQLSIAAHEIPHPEKVQLLSSKPQPVRRHVSGSAVAGVIRR